MRLLESSGGRQRYGKGATVSVVVHAAVIVGAVIGTAQARSPEPARRDVVIDFVYDPPRPPERSQRMASGPARPGQPSSGERTIEAPREVLHGLPPIDVEVANPVDGQTPVMFGPSRGEVGGGFEGPRTGGAPDASGTWDAHAVEIPVVPDARNPVPAYPEVMRAAGLAGRVVAEFVVDSMGRVRAGSATIVESTHEAFAASVRRTLPSLRFTPARVQGRRVAQRVRMPFEFEVR